MFNILAKTTWKTEGMQIEFMNFNGKINENIECALLIIDENSTWTLAERVTTVFVYHTLKPSSQQFYTLRFFLFFFFLIKNGWITTFAATTGIVDYSFQVYITHPKKNVNYFFAVRQRKENKKKWITLVRVHCGLRYYSSQVHATTELVMYGHRRRHRK